MAHLSPVNNKIIYAHKNIEFLPNTDQRDILVEVEKDLQNLKEVQRDDVDIKKEIIPSSEVAARPVVVRTARARAVNAVTKKRGHTSVFCLPSDDLFSSLNHLLTGVPVPGVSAPPPSAPMAGRGVTFTQKSSMMFKYFVIFV